MCIETRRLRCPTCGEWVDVTVEYHGEGLDFSAAPHTTTDVPTVTEALRPGAPRGMLFDAMAHMAMGRRPRCEGGTQEGWREAFMDWLDNAEEDSMDRRLHQAMDGDV